MNRKALIITLAIIALSLGAYLGLRALRGAPVASTPRDTTSQPPYTLPPVPTSTLPQGGKLSINTPRGIVPVRNFYADALEVNSERDAVIAVVPEYRMIYFGKDTAFLLTIERTPFAEARAKAEADFLANLGISKEDACRLTVLISVPREIDEELAGRNFGLSFCRDGVYTP